MKIAKIRTMLEKSEFEIIKTWVYTEPLLVSISCIVYNQRNFIEEALDSFLMQITDFPFEILVHDDASIDGTTEIIKKYESRFPNLIKPLYQKENQYSKGKKINIEFNFPRAKGKYIALCEGDDYWTDPKKLQKQVNFMELNNEYVLCYHLSKMLIGNRISDITYPPIGKDYTKKELLTTTTLIPTASKLFRNIYTENRKKELLDFAEDTLFNVYLGFYGCCKFLNDINPSIYRTHSNGIWSKLKKREKFLYNLEVFIKLCRLLETRGYTEIVDKRLNDAFLYFNDNLLIYT